MLLQDEELRRLLATIVDEVTGETMTISALRVSCGCVVASAPVAHIKPGEIALTVRNDGPDAVSIAQVQVNRKAGLSFANALRAAMMGLLGEDGLTSEPVHEVLDLCLSCKACKSECPSSVDMAKLKAEWQDLYHADHGTPLRSRVFANIAILNRLGHIAAPITNAMLKGPAKWAMTRLGGLWSRSGDLSVAASGRSLRPRARIMHRIVRDHARWA